jgi:hypothetical protein
VRRLPVGSCYGSVRVGGLTLTLWEREAEGQRRPTFELLSYWGGGHLDAAELVVAAEALRPMLAAIAPELLSQRPEVRHA